MSIKRSLKNMASFLICLLAAFGIPNQEDGVRPLVGDEKVAGETVKGAETVVRKFLVSIAEGDRDSLSGLLLAGDAVASGCQFTPRGPSFWKRPLVQFLEQPEGKNAWLRIDRIRSTRLTENSALVKVHFRTGGLRHAGVFALSRIDGVYRIGSVYLDQTFVW